MSNGTWTDAENDLIVADYFAMLADDIAGRPCNKAEHRLSTLLMLHDQSEGAASTRISAPCCKSAILQFKRVAYAEARNRVVHQSAERCAPDEPLMDREA